MTHTHASSITQLQYHTNHVQSTRSTHATSVGMVTFKLFTLKKAYDQIPIDSVLRAAIAVKVLTDKIFIIALH